MGVTGGGTGMDADQTLLDGYARHQRARGFSEDTVRCYRDTFRPFVRALHDGGLTLCTAERGDVVDWIEARGVTNRTRAMYTSRLDLLYRWMQDEGHRPDYPTKGLPRAKSPRGVPRPIPAAKLYLALELADPRIGLMITLTAFAGLRRQEIAKIDRADILDDRTPALLLVHGKGSKERLVPIGPVLAAAFARFGIPAGGPLFVGPRGGALTRHTVGLLISGHYKACGIDATPHQGRHTFASQLYEVSGGDLRVVQEMLGHQSPTSTAIYAAWSPDRAVAAIAALPGRPLEPDEAA